MTLPDIYDQPWGIFDNKNVMKEGGRTNGKITKNKRQCKKRDYRQPWFQKNLYTEVVDLRDTSDVCKFGDLQFVLRSHVMYLFKYKRCDDTRQYCTVLAHDSNICDHDSSCHRYSTLVGK